MIFVGVEILGNAATFRERKKICRRLSTSSIKRGMSWRELHERKEHAQKSDARAELLFFVVVAIDVVVAITLYYQKLLRLIVQTFPELSLPVVLSNLNLEHFEANNVGW